MADPDDASFIRPRLFDADDPRNPDLVETILSSLETQKQVSMAEGDSDTVENVLVAQRKVAEAAGGHYEEEYR